MYFLLEGVRPRLVHLNKGLGAILFYVGCKMILSNWYHIDPFVSLGIIAVILTITVIASLRMTSHAEAPEQPVVPRSAEPAPTTEPETEPETEAETGSSS
jgi:tellurite resistance protein TerC